MIRPLSAREIKILIFTIAVAVLAALSRLVYFPLVQRQTELDDKIAETRGVIRGEDAVIRRARAVDARYRAYQDRFLVRGTQEEAVAAILKDLETTIREFNLDVDDLKPGPVKSEEGVYEFPVNLSLSHNLPDLVRFLYTLQREPFLFTVEDLQVEKITRRNNTGLKTKLQISKLFILPEKSEGAQAGGENGADE